MSLSIVGFSRAVCTLCWLVWLPSSAAVIGRASRRVLARLSWPQKLTLVLFPALALLAAYLIPIRSSVDPFYLCSWSDPWKGLSGRVLLDLAAPFTRNPELAALWIARLSYLALPFLALALLDMGEPPASFGGGSIFVLTLLLIINPIMLEGSLLARYAFFVPATLAVMLTANRDCLSVRGAAAPGALISSLVLFGWSRPEISPVALLLAGMLIWHGRRQGRRPAAALSAGLLAVVAVLLATLPAQLQFLVGQARIDTISLRGNILGGRPLWMMLPLFAENALHNLPRMLAQQTIGTGGLLILAAARIVTLARRRSAGSVEQWLCAGVLSAYFVVAAPHCEGLGEGGGVVKYGLLINLPIWYLAASCLLDLARRGRRQLWLAALAAALSLASCLHAMRGYARDSLAQRAIVIDREGLFYTTAREFALQTCPPAASPACVAFGTAGDLLSGDSLGSVDDARTLVRAQLSDNGCQLSDGSKVDVSSGAPEHLAQLLCPQRPTCSRGGTPSFPSHALILHQARPDGPRELDGFLDGPRNCGWHRVQAWSLLTILKREPAQPEAAAPF
jgi:hypothetical protein